MFTVANTRKRPVRFGSVRFLIRTVPVPTVRFQNPVPPVPVPPVPKKVGKTSKAKEVKKNTKTKIVDNWP